MAEDDLLDSMDDGGGDASPAPKKKAKGGGGGGGLPGFLPAIITIVVISIVVFVVAGKKGNPEFEQKLGEAIDGLARNQELIMHKLEKPSIKLDGVTVPRFVDPAKNPMYYLEPRPMTLNVGTDAFAKTSILVVIDGESVKEHMEHEEGGGGGHGGGHGGGGGDEPSTEAPAWFKVQYSPQLANGIQELFGEVDYSAGQYTVSVEGKKKQVSRAKLREILVSYLNQGLSHNPDVHMRIVDVQFPDFIISNS